MKKYFVFAGDTFYPGGGMCDFRGTFDSYEDAMKRITHEDDHPAFDWAQIVTIENGVVVNTDEF